MTPHMLKTKWLQGVYHQDLVLSRFSSFLVSSMVNPQGHTIIQSQSASTKASLVIRLEGPAPPSPLQTKGNKGNCV